MSATLRLALLPDELAQGLIAFDRLPSRWLHPTRAQAQRTPVLAALWQAAGDDATAQASLHRHWSAALLGVLRLAPVDRWDDPALPLAILPEASWQALLRLAGASLLGPRIRMVIEREARQTLLQHIGEAAWRHALQDTPPLPGAPSGLHVPLAELGPLCVAWGEAVLWRALQPASDAVRERARLRMPEATGPLAERTLRAVPPEAALPWALSLIPLVEPTWLSSFPVTH